MTEVLFLAFALSMDAFAVSLCIGVRNTIHVKKVAFISALYFGFFQGLMPLIGYFIGKYIVGYFRAFDHWIAFIILFTIGSKMIYESFKSESCELAPSRISHKTLFFLSIATSIDALAAGLTINLINISPYLSVLIIGCITFIISYLGVFIGLKTGTWLEKKAEFLGGLTLVFISIKILYEHDVLG